ncbi:MAG: hypothetical protein ACO1OF_12610, partial [Adhaeribacter sp.]
EQVIKIRQQLPGIGTDKLHYLLTDFLAEHQLKLGRDKLYDLLREHQIQAYNNLRPHASCDYLTPSQAHQQQGPLKKRWRKYERKNLTNTSQIVNNLKALLLNIINFILT